MKRGIGDSFLIDFSDYSLGLNTKESHFGIKPKQAYNGSINARFKARGFDRVPGFFGLAETPPFTTYCKGLEIYSRVDGTQKLMGFSNGRLYEVNPTTNVATERYNLTGTGEAFGVSAVAVPLIVGLPVTTTFPVRLSMFGLPLIVSTLKYRNVESWLFKSYQRINPISTLSLF